MQEKSPVKGQKQKILERISLIRKKIAAMEHVCSGTVVASRIKCGKPNCRCASDDSYRHGPYYQWNRMKKGKLVHSTVNADQAQQLKLAIMSYRTILKLLRAWEEETSKTFGIQKKRK